MVGRTITRLLQLPRRKVAGPQISAVLVGMCTERRGKCYRYLESRAKGSRDCRGKKRIKNGAKVLCLAAEWMVSHSLRWGHDGSSRFGSENVS